MHNIEVTFMDGEILYYYADFVEPGAMFINIFLGEIITRIPIAHVREISTYKDDE